MALRPNLFVTVYTNTLYIQNEVDIPGVVDSMDLEEVLHVPQVPPQQLRPLAQ